MERLMYELKPFGCLGLGAMFFSTAPACGAILLGAGVLILRMRYAYRRGN